MGISFKNKTDKEIAEYLYSRFCGKLFNYAISSWKLNEDEIWEILYETIYKFIDVYSCKDYEQEREIAVILWTIYKNKLRDAIRKNKRIQEQYKEVFLNEKENYKITNENIDNEIKSNPLLAHLESILRELEDWERQLLLCRTNNFPYKEIEEITGKKSENLKVYYQRLKKKISEKMQKYILENKER